MQISLTVLEMLKVDLGINHNKRDSFLNNKLSACATELEEKGVNLDLAKTEDIMLLSDYTAWQYRHRTENVPLAKNLDLRIKNVRTKERAK